VAKQQQEASKENITFRLDKNILDMLRFEAEEKSSSVNNVAQAVFSMHYKWTASAAKAGMVPVPKQLLSMLLDKLDDEDIPDIAKHFAELRIKDMTLVLRNNYDLTAFLDVLDAWMGVSSVNYSKRMNEKEYVYTISHDIGGKWSMFLSLLLQMVFKRIGVPEVTFDVTDSTILFAIPRQLLRAR
jgi:hypothetical protein